MSKFHTGGYITESPARPARPARPEVIVPRKPAPGHITVSVTYRHHLFEYGRQPDLKSPLSRAVRARRRDTNGQ